MFESSRLDSLFSLELDSEGNPTTKNKRRGNPAEISKGIRAQTLFSSWRERLDEPTHMSDKQETLERDPTMERDQIDHCRTFSRPITDGR